MALAQGTRVGPYEIVSSLGAGGAIGPPLVVAQNWFEELKRLVPAD